MSFLAKNLSKRAFWCPFFGALRNFVKMSFKWNRMIRQSSTQSFSFNSDLGLAIQHCYVCILYHWNMKKFWSFLVEETALDDLILVAEAQRHRLIIIFSVEELQNIKLMVKDASIAMLYCPNKLWTLNKSFGGGFAYHEVFLRSHLNESSEFSQNGELFR